MTRPNVKQRNRIQNVLILLLSISAAFLFYLTQFGTPRFSAPRLLAQSEDGGISDERVFLQEMDWPVTVLTSDSFGSRRLLRLSTGDSSFTAAEGLLEDAFRSELLWKECDFAFFRSAMDESSLCILLPDPVPVQIIAARLGLLSSEHFFVSSVLLSCAETQVLICCSDGARHFQSACPIAAELLTAVIDSLGGEACTLADENEGVLASFSPLTACSAELPALPLLTGETAESLFTPAILLPQYGFNAHTTSRYTEVDGTEVIVESPRRLRISPSGTVYYLGDTKNAPDAFVLSAQGDLSEIVGGTYQLLRQLLDGAEVKTQLYLSSAEENGGTCTLCFDAMAGGLPLVAGSGESAARAVISDGVITELSLRYRNYAVSDTDALLLPFTQALAVASDYEGMRMDLCYIDSARETVAPSWFMR